MDLSGRIRPNVEAAPWVIDEIEKLEQRLGKIVQWIEAYPLEVFPEPDFKKAAEVLKANGMTLDAISASNMRHVLNRIKAIIGA